MEDKQPEQSQLDKFRDLARDLECDEDEAAFEETVRKVANSSVQQPEPGGEWKVEDAKRGRGYKAKFYPVGYGPSPESDAFPTPEEAQAWISEQERPVK